MCYYDNDEENAKCRGAFSIKSFVDVSDVTEKENGIDIVMSNNKIMQVAAENSEDSNDWYRYARFYLDISFFNCISKKKVTKALSTGILNRKIIYVFFCNLKNVNIKNQNKFFEVVCLLK